MQRLGFIHDMLDVKVLILFVMARVSYPVNIQQIYELSYQDDCLSYFDVCTAVPEMVKSGHLKELEEGQFEKILQTRHWLQVISHLYFVQEKCLQKLYLMQ